MRYATFSHGSDSTARLGIVRGDQIIDASTLGVPSTASLLELIPRQAEALASKPKATVPRKSAGTRRFRGRQRTSSASAATTRST
jgi:hypothetical protein